MNEHKSELSFTNYLVKYLSYELNDNFIPKKDQILDVGFDIEAEILITEDEEVVTLSVNCGDENNEDCPFIINTIVTGTFEYSGDKNKSIEFLKTNGIAILYPYVRSIISDISGKSNIFPQYKLPLINVVALLEDTNRITVTDKA